MIGLTASSIRTAFRGMMLDEADDRTMFGSRTRSDRRPAERINGIENFWNQAKRHLRRFNGVPKQSHLFLKECEWRFNGGDHRELLNRIEDMDYFETETPLARTARKKKRQTVCKPGSVPADAGDGHSSATPVAGRLVRPTRAAGAETHLPRALRPRRAAPIRSCSRWGLPCRRRCRRRGALLPHPFTLTRQPRRRGAGAGTGGLLSVALSLGSPPPGVTRHRVPVEPGLSSPRLAPEGGHPTVWHA